jgi:chromosome segregation ATPase
MNEDPTKSFSHEDRNGLREEVHSINQRLQRVEEKLDERSRETRPMSERIDQILAMVAGTQDEVRSHTVQLREINRTLRRVNVDLATSLRNQDELDDRVTALEDRPAQI